VTIQLDARVHAAYELAPDLLLVRKPAGHTEHEHSHPHALRLRVVRGRLAVRLGDHETILDEEHPACCIAAGVPHATEALEPTWVLVERDPPSTGGSREVG
jgi:quercetin dioxygenase-like cupin family protein